MLQESCRDRRRCHGDIDWRARVKNEDDWQGDKGVGGWERTCLNDECLSLCKGIVNGVEARQTLAPTTTSLFGLVDLVVT